MLRGIGAGQLWCEGMLEVERGHFWTRKGGTSPRKGGTHHIQTPFLSRVALHSAFQICTSNIASMNPRSSMGWLWIYLGQWDIYPLPCCLMSCTGFCTSHEEWLCQHSLVLGCPGCTKETVWLSTKGASGCTGGRWGKMSLLPLNALN